MRRGIEFWGGGQFAQETAARADGNNSHNSDSTIVAPCSAALFQHAYVEQQSIKCRLFQAQIFTVGAAR